MTLLITSLYFLAAIAGAMYALFELRLLVRFLRHRPAVLESVRSRPPTPAPGKAAAPAPTVTIQIPLYNERTAARQVILAAAAQDYPPDRFDVQVLDDSTDETSAIVAELVAELNRKREAGRAGGPAVHHIRRGHRAGFKAGALAEGLERSTAEFVAIFDADFTPDPSFLRTLLLEEGSFEDGKVAFVQTRWAWSGPPRGLFHPALALLLDRHFFVQKPTKAFMGNVTTFNGSGGIWRRAAIDDAGGWSADTLTEDLDLSYRCAFRGWKGRYLRDVAVPSELPGDMRALKLQQHRWARGNAQCLRKLSGEVLRSGEAIRERGEEAHLLAGYAIHPVLVANLILWPFAVLLVNRPLFFALQILLSLFTLVAPASFLLALKERGERITAGGLLRVLAGVCLGLGLMAANTVGQIQGFLSRKGEFARTPKGPRPDAHRAPCAGGSLDTAADRPYATPLHWTFFLELALLAYAAGAFVVLVQRGEPFWALPLLFWGGCLGLVIWLQLAANASPIGARRTAPATA